MVMLPIRAVGIVSVSAQVSSACARVGSVHCSSLQSNGWCSAGGTAATSYSWHASCRVFCFAKAPYRYFIVGTSWLCKHGIAFLRYTPPCHRGREHHPGRQTQGGVVKMAT